MTESIGRMVTLLARSIQKDLKNVIEPFGISVGEEPYFMALVREDGLTQDELTQRVKVDKAATARAVKSLEAKGILLRRAASDDRRSKRLYLTEEGRALYTPLRAALAAYNEQLTAEWTGAQYDLCYKSLAALLQKLDNQGE